MGFSKVLLEFRAKHDLTQTQLADIIGVGIVMIYGLTCNCFITNLSPNFDILMMREVSL